MCDESFNAFNSNEIKTSCQNMDMCFVAFDGVGKVVLHLNWEAPCCQSFSGYFVFAVFYVFFFLWLLLLHSPKWEIISANTARLFYRET